MDYEKKYKEALERARQFSEKPYLEDSKGIVDYIFPELKESEDERMKNAAIRACKYIIDNFENSTKDYEDAIAWLEKQGKNNMGISEATKQELEDNLNKALEKETPESWNEFLDEQKPAWSEEDELYIRELESLVKQVWATAEHENDKDTIHKMSDLSFFLKTLKPQLKQEWSEEDERMYNIIVSYIPQHLTAESYTACIYWLKSLKERYTWKPSERQIQSIRDCALNKNIDADTRLVLDALYQDLLKLREG